MAGIYPDGGVPVGQATNTVNVASVNCTSELFYSTNRCTPRFEPAAQNALISEILNAATALGDPYNCGSLANLRATLLKINNLCNQDDNTTPDLNDSLAGCFDGVSGKTTIQLLSNLILGQITSLCELATVAPDLDDTVAGCFDGVEGRASISSILNLGNQDGPCSYPTVASPDLDDLLAGCYDGAAGKATVQSIVDLVLAQVTGAALYSRSTEVTWDAAANNSDPYDIRTWDAILVTDITSAAISGSPILAGSNPRDLPTYLGYRTDPLPTVDGPVTSCKLIRIGTRWWRFSPEGVRQNEIIIPDQSAAIFQRDDTPDPDTLPTFYRLIKL